MKLLACLLSFVFLASCSHHHKAKGHHHHDKDSETSLTSCKECQDSSKVMYEKHCAHSVMLGDTHTAGKDEYLLEHGGKSYYFSSAEKMDMFKADIAENSRKADRSWESGRR